MQVIEMNQFIATTLRRAPQPFDNVQMTILMAIDPWLRNYLRYMPGGYCYKEVEENQYPSIGYVWFKKSEDGMTELWRANYDSSD